MQRTYLALAVLLLASPVLANTVSGNDWPSLGQPPLAPPPVPLANERSAQSSVVALEVIPFRATTGAN